MMRRPLTTLVLASTCGLIAIAGAAALGAELVHGASAPGARSGAHGGARAWPLTLSPAPGELALAQVSFHSPRSGRLPRGSLRVAASGPFGADYLAAATPGFSTRGAMHVLILLVDRPSPLLDPASVHLRLDAWRSLGAPVLRTLADPFMRARPAHRPALCDLPANGSSLGGSQLRALSSRGSALAGFDAASAVAQAYDVACGLPYAAAFKQAVEQPSSGSPSPLPAPSPSPPVGKLPGEGCMPRAGYACPG